MIQFFVFLRPAGNCVRSVSTNLGSNIANTRTHLRDKINTTEVTIADNEVFVVSRRDTRNVNTKLSE